MNKTTYIILGVLAIIFIVVLYIHHHIKIEVTESLKRKTAHLHEPPGVHIWCKKMSSHLKKNQDDFYNANYPDDQKTENNIEK